MAHLVSICFHEKIHPFILEKAAVKKGIPKYFVKKIFNSREYREIKRRSLFLGISDGAKIDQLRRASGISNEQVFSSYYVSVEKKDDLLKELVKDGFEDKFNSIYLIDDFTGSGLSYVRYEDNKHTGKLIKFLKLVYNVESNSSGISALPDLFDINNIDLHVLFYIARSNSLEYIRKELGEWQKETGLNFQFTVDAIQQIGENYKSEVTLNTALVDLSRKHIKKSIIDRHYEKGKHEQYYLGFDECSLPLVLHHNTPNNSLPILWWYPEDEDFRGLFPRVTRHRE